MRGRADRARAVRVHRNREPMSFRQQAWRFSMPFQNASTQLSLFRQLMDRIAHHWKPCHIHSPCDHSCREKRHEELYQPQTAQTRLRKCCHAARRERQPGTLRIFIHRYMKRSRADEFKQGFTASPAQAQKETVRAEAERPPTVWDNAASSHRPRPLRCSVCRLF